MAKINKRRNLDMQIEKTSQSIISFSLLIIRNDIVSDF